jgi:hypothetical protein
MKNISTASITFNASAKTVNTGIGSFDIRKLYAIINTTASKIIYATGTTGLGYTTINGSTVTLVFDTTIMSNTDVLQIIYDTNIVTVDGSGVTQPISNSNLDVALSTRTKPSDQQHTIIDSGTVSVSNFPGTQPISASSLPLPSGSATSANQSTGNTSLASIDTKLTNPLPISGTVSTGLSQPLTDTQLRASSVLLH